MKSIKHKAQEEIIRVLPDDIKATEALIKKNAVTKDSTMTIEDLALAIKVVRVREAMSELDLTADGVKDDHRELQEELEKTYKHKFFQLSIPELETLLERIRDHGCMGCDYNCPASCIYDPDAPDGFGEGGRNEPWYPAICPLYPDVESVVQGLIHRLKIYNIDTDYWERTEGYKPTVAEVFRDLSDIVRKAERRLTRIGKGPNGKEVSPLSKGSRELVRRINKAFETLDGSFDIVRGHPCCSVCAEDELVHRNRFSGKTLHAHWTMDFLDFAEPNYPKVGINFGVTGSGRKHQAASSLTQALKCEGLDVDESDIRWGCVRVSLKRSGKRLIRAVK
jgi:hypothetical protein